MGLHVEYVDRETPLGHIADVDVLAVGLSPERHMGWIGLGSIVLAKFFVCSHAELNNEVRVGMAAHESKALATLRRSRAVI